MFTSSSPTAINLPDKKYQDYQSGCNYSFKIPTYAAVWNDSSEHTNACWKNVVFPSLNGRIHLSYYTVNSPKELIALMENARKLAFKHTVKATAINEGIIYYPEKRVYGIYYTIEGNTASAVQFYLTDSSKNYLRAALYFNEQPRIDSIKPVLNFIKKDIDVFIKTFQWKR